MSSHRALGSILLVIAAAAVALPALALEAWMSEAEIVARFKGTSIDGHYASGKTFSEDYRPDGRLEYQERDRLSGGRWSVEAGAFCTIYDRDPTGGCYRIKRVSPNCFEFYFVARTEDQLRRGPNEPSWTARGWVKSETATCADGASV